MSLSPGQQLGRYEIVAPLGEGGMGEIYRANDSRLGRAVAVKVLPASLASDPERLHRFEQEARATGALDHPNVLVVHDFGTHDGAPYLVSELLDGETLRERVSRGPIAPRKAAEIAARVAHGLAAAHGRGIVHRDLKPDNVFLTGDGRVKILDFGLAKVKGPLGVDTEGETLLRGPVDGTSPGALLGTAGYMAPEQARGQPADARSDVFSLGAILYEMLSGRRAFARGSMAETLSAILHEDPPGQLPLSSSVPRALESLVRRCLEKDPGDRFQTARDLGFALDAVAQGSQSEDRRSRPAELGSALRAWHERLGLARGRAWPALLVLVLGAGLGVGAALLLRQPAPPRVTSYRWLLSGAAAVPARWVNDGERLYYSAPHEGRLSLWQLPLAGGEPERIATPFQHALVHDVMPGRGTLLVAGWDGGLTGAESADQPLWIVPPAGGSARNTGLKAYSAAWSPDGARIAYGGGSEDFARRPRSRLFVAAADGSGSRRVHDAGVPIESLHWSPDGSRVRFCVFDRSRAEWWWLEVAADGSSPPRRLVPGEAGDWSPDGRHFVFGRWGGEGDATHDHGPRFNLHVRREPRGVWPWSRPRITQLTAGPMDFGSPSFTPDGRQIVASGTLRRMELLRLAPGTSQFVRVPGTPGGFVDYSRDGAWVAWVDASSLTVWRSRRDGSGRLQLTAPPMAAALVRWSPDGRRLAFVADPAGGRQPRAVYVVSRDGGRLESFTDPQQALVWDQCWLDDDHLAWGNLYDRGSVKVVDLRTRAISELPGSQGMMGPKCSPRGEVLAAKEWTQGFWLYTPEKRRWEALGVSSNLWYPTFTRDGTAVYGLSLDDRAIYRFGLEERRLEQVARLGTVEPTAPWMAAWMGLDPDDAPILLRNIGLADLYLLDWESE